MLETQYIFFVNTMLRWAKFKKVSRKIFRSLKKLFHPTQWSSRMYQDVIKILNSLLIGYNKDKQNYTTILKTILKNTKQLL